MRNKIKPCPFCGGFLYIGVCDDEGNDHDEEYENNPWSGLGYKLKHSWENNPGCPIATYADDGADIGTYIYDTWEEAVEAWNKRVEC